MKAAAKLARLLSGLEGQETMDPGEILRLRASEAMEAPARRAGAQSSGEVRTKAGAPGAAELRAAEP
jgi:hypothetical protein